MENNSTAIENHKDKEPKSLLYYALFCIELVFKKFKFHFFFVLTITLVAVILTLLVDNFYTSTAEIIPPSSPQSSVASSVLGGNQALMSMAGLGELSRNKYADLCLSIANSQSYKRNIIQKFNLTNYYEFKPKNLKIELVIQAFSKDFSVVENDLGMLEVSFSSKSPELCSLVVDYSAKMLDSVFLETQKERAKTEQTFVKHKLAEMRRRVDSLTKEFVIFQISKKAYDPGQQTGQLIDAMYKLEAQKLQILSDKQIGQKIEGDFSPSVKRLEITEKILNSIIDSLKGGSLKSSSIFNNLKESPALNIEFEVKKTELKFTAEMLTYFTKFDEELELKASTDFKQTQILTPGYKPQKKTGPPRTIIVLLTFFLTNLFSVFLIAFHRYLMNEKTNKSTIWDKIMEIKDANKNILRMKK